MAEPGILPLRSSVGFKAGTREAILAEWQQGIESHNVNIQYESAVVNIDGKQGNFLIKLANGKVVHAEFIILGIGVQGNPRKLGVVGEDADFVQYTLDNPDEHRDESIVVVGAGDDAGLLGAFSPYNPATAAADFPQSRPHRHPVPDRRDLHSLRPAIRS